MTATRPEIVFHINPHEAASWRGRERLAIFARIAEVCESHGLSFSAIPRASGETRRQNGLADGKLHIVENGRIEGEGWLNTGLAYLLGFWHLDPHGIQAESRARNAVFSPRDVAFEPALDFFKTLRRRFAKSRISRFNQPRKRDDTLPEDAIAIFLQGLAPIRAGHCDLPMHEMIHTVSRNAGGRAVVVKPHPRAMPECAAAMARAAAEGAVFTISEANVHDLLASCAVTVSANSAVAMEGFLHRKPAILFGQSDFESLVTRVHQPADFPQALHQALTTERRYAKMIHWYFTRHTLEVAAPDFEAHLLDTFAKVGFGRDQLGL